MKFRVSLSTALLILLIYSTVLAQDQQPASTPEPTVQGHAEMGQMGSMDSDPDPVCDVEAFLLQQQAFESALSTFSQVYEMNPEAALLTVYYIGTTYQAFAINCGFVPSEELVDAHNADHTASEDEHTDEAHMELALSLGDPDNGQMLFNTLIPEAGFACATCHRVDSTETLIGPGLVNIANPGHDPSQHEHGNDAATTETRHPEKTMDEVLNYIRTSILSPGDEVVPGFPDLLMPRVYAQVFNEQQVNDIIAYLLTLHE